MNEDFESAKAILRKVDSNGRTLYDHLTQTILEVVKEKPENPLEAFKQIAVRIDQNTTDPTVYKELPVVAENTQEYEKIQQSIQRTTSLLKPELDEDEQEPDPVMIPDLISEAQLLEWAGVNLGLEEVYKLYLSIQKLANAQQLEEVRFVGKVLGTKADYYIVEAKPPEFPESADDDDENSKVEAWGTGVNEYAYYATNSPEDEWVMLPQLRPEWIIIARDVRRYFSGDFNAPVLGFPRFPGNEAAYLRAQIARIVASTVIAPHGMYIPDDGAAEELDIVIRDEEYQGVPAIDLSSVEQWEHTRAHLLNQGRVTPWINPNLDDEDEQEDENEEEVIRKLRSIAEDDHGFGPISRDNDATGSWSLQIQPDPESPYACVCLQSNAWPGAYTVARDQQLVNIYVGYGIKFIDGTYTPPPPPLVQSEYVSTYNPDEDEVDPLLEQEDPEPPKDHPEDEDEDEEDGEDDIDLDDDDDEYHD